MLLKRVFYRFKKLFYERGRMIKLRDYGFYKVSGGMCPYEDVVKGVDAFVIGRVHDSHDKHHSLNGEILCTHKIVDMYNKVILTDSGAVYVLENMHPDYKEFLMINAARTL